MSPATRPVSFCVAVVFVLQFDRSRWVAFVNKVTDEASKSTITWPSSYSPIQLIFFKAIVSCLGRSLSFLFPWLPT